MMRLREDGEKIVGNVREVARMKREMLFWVKKNLRPEEKFVWCSDAAYPLSDGPRPAVVPAERTEHADELGTRDPRRRVRTVEHR
jgi:hypothetical protein